ncbi:MAG: hypothetical protein HZA88_13385 [Verrucomicrobia bacterium]|nr:hypothetical protein [Verrucomicrobiota bacterium]
MSKAWRTSLKIIGALLVLGTLAAFMWCSSYSPYQYGNYIPANLEDAHAWLQKHLPAEELQRIRNMESEGEMNIYHFGLGMGMRNEWALWAGSRLSRYFNELGIHHPDDMSGIILTTFWRRLHNQPLRLDEQVAYYKAYWERVTVPDNLRTPSGATIEFDQSYGRGTEANPRTIHVGKSADGSVWVYEHGKGLQPMSAEIQKIVDEKP